MKTQHITEEQGGRVFLAVFLLLTVTVMSGIGCTGAALPISPTVSMDDTNPSPVPENMETALPTQPIDRSGLSFTANPDPVTRGGTLMLNWKVPDASRITIARLSETGGTRLEEIGTALDPIGTLTYTIPETYVMQIPFELDADNLTQIGLTVHITCSFPETLTDVCPYSHDPIQAAFQAFEHGFMVGRADTDEIYVLYSDAQYPGRETYGNTYIEGELFDVGEIPPEGRIQPERGFGKVWATTPAVRSRLGWALEPEVSYTATIEVHLGVWNRPDTIVLTLPDGRAVSLGGVNPPSWSFVK